MSTKFTDRFKNNNQSSDGNKSQGGNSFAERFGKKPAMTGSKAFGEQDPNTNPLDNPPPQGQKSFSSNMDKKTDAIDDAVKKANSDLVYLVKGLDRGRKAWYYVLVERLKLSLFLKALNDPIIHLEKYGKILYSAYGEEPPKDIVEKIKKEFGIR